jgi:hypothetical protein
MSMDAEDDGLHDDEEDGDAACAAARGDSCLNMNPMRMALPAAGCAFAHGPSGMNLKRTVEP